MIVALLLDERSAAETAQVLAGFFTWQRARGGDPPEALLTLAEAFLRAVEGHGGPIVAVGAGDGQVRGVTSPPILVRLPEAARLLGVSERATRRLVTDGSLVPRKIGGATVFAVADLVAFADSLAPTSFRTRIVTKDGAHGQNPQRRRPVTIHRRTG